MLNAWSPLRRWRLLLGAIAVFVVTLTGGPARAEPALWAVHSATATVYLFGTVHALKPDTVWHSAKLDAAFASADELWLEIPNADDAQAGAALMRQYGVDPAHPLSGKLSPALLADLDKAARLSGVPSGEAGLETVRPWLAAIVISTAPLRMAGYDLNSGVDLKLKAAAQAAGKPIHGFETYEQQIRYFADMSEANQLAFLKSAADEVADGPVKLKQMITAWEAGDVPKLTGFLLEQDVLDAPDLYRVLFVERNRRFAAAVADRLKGTGISFMAVGAGHLLGPDSVQVQLAARGITAERQ